MKLLVLTLLAQLLTAHTIITYPGWRGDNLKTSGTIGVDDYGDHLFPYGMQWAYPCGGMDISNNRTKWPTTGGALAVQPGWFSGHEHALIYVNIGLGNVPVNYSLPMLPVFQIVGPRNTPYPGDGFCLPQVPLPAGVVVKAGDNATIQIVEAAVHGAALYNCVDITFTDDMDEVATVNETNCVNSTDMSFALVFSTLALRSAACGVVPLSSAALFCVVMALALLLVR